MMRMISLYSHLIRAFLENEQEAHIEGLGCFFKIRKEADEDASKGFISPPEPHIGFKEYDVFSNGFKGYSLSKTRLNTQQWDKLTAAFSSIILDKVLNVGSVELPSLGVLCLENDKIKLRQERGEDISFLPMVSMSPITRDSETVATAIKNIQDDNIVPGRTYDRATGRFSWGRALTVALIAVAIIILFFLVRSCYQSSNYSSDNLGDGDTIGLSVPESDNSSPIAEATSLRDSNKTLAYEDSITQKGLQDSDQESHWTEGGQALDQITECIVILGVFHNAANADRMIIRLEDMGYSMYKGINPEGLTRVGFTFDCSETNLEEYIREVRKNMSPKAWYLSPSIHVPL